MRPAQRGLTALFALCLAVFAATSGEALAAQNRVVTERADTILASEAAEFSPGATAWFVLHQKIKPGWHVYWRNPGDSGLPLDLQWRLPEGFEAGEALYPLPERLPIGPLANFGHKDEASFLVGIKTPADAAIGAQIEVGLTATWLICEDICVPETGEFALTLPVQAQATPDPSIAEIFAQARASLPQKLQGAVVEASPRKITLRAPTPEQAANVFFFPYTDGLVEPAAPQRARRSNGQIRLTMRPGHSYAPSRTDFSGVLVVEDQSANRRGFEVLEPPVEWTGARTAARTGAPEAPGLALLLLTAFFGGVLLNVMPCVFPVIFIKAAQLMKSAQSSRAQIRRHGLLYAAGVLATFALLGGLLLALRAGGEGIGWGFHLQSPTVVLASAFVLFALGLNLAGVFHAGESLQGVGAEVAGQRGGAGAFLTGMLAVFVAAPCIGPLLSAPMGAAILLPAASGFSIFVAMGLGLAAPYLALSFVPALAARLPRPGPWMTIFKKALSFPVFAGAAYFLYVLAEQAGSQGLAGALAGILLLALAAWTFELSKGARAKAALRTGAALCLGLALYLGATVRETQSASPSGEFSYGAFDAIAFDPARIEALRAEGKGVFLDFTAAWCATCQIDRLTVFSDPALARRFAQKGVVFMVADWTRRDEEIAATLEAFGANGVPFYVYYPPEGAPRPLRPPINAAAIEAAFEQ